MADFLEGDYRALIGGDNADNRGSTLSVTPNVDGSILERLEELQGISRVAVSSSQILADATTIFTVTGGPIIVWDLISICTVVMEATAFTLQWSADGSAAGQAAATFTGASGSLTGFAAGGMVYCNFTALTTAPVITQTTGVGLRGPTTSTGGGIYVQAGIITTTVTNGPIEHRQACGTTCAGPRWARAAASRRANCQQARADAPFGLTGSNGDG
jgi:hypothetical protein